MRIVAVHSFADRRNLLNVAGLPPFAANRQLFMVEYLPRSRWISVTMRRLIMGR